MSEFIPVLQLTLPTELRDNSWAKRQLSVRKSSHAASLSESVSSRDPKIQKEDRSAEQDIKDHKKDGSASSAMATSGELRGLIPDVYIDSGYKPNGVKCCWCVLRDDDWDPVLKAKGIAYWCMWGYAPTKEGKSQGKVCWYCMRIFTGEFKYRLKDGKRWTQAMFSDFLGKDQNLEKHKIKCDLLIQYMIKNGGSHKQSVCFTTLEEKTVTVLNRKQLQITHPGFDFY